MVFAVRTTPKNITTFHTTIEVNDFTTKCSLYQFHLRFGESITSGSTTPKWHINSVVDHKSSHLFQVSGHSTHKGHPVGQALFHLFAKRGDLAFYDVSGQYETEPGTDIHVTHIHPAWIIGEQGILISDTSHIKCSGTAYACPEYRIKTVGKSQSFSTRTA